MSNVFQFPDRLAQRASEDDCGGPLLGIPYMVVFDRLMEANFNLFRLISCMDVAEGLEMFLDPLLYPGQILVDLSGFLEAEDLRGLYRIDLTDYSLVKLEATPLKHFN